MNWSLAISLGASIIVGIIGFFFKRTISIADESVRQLDKTKASKEELTQLKGEMSKRLEKLSGDVESIKENYITKEDFYREQSKTERKLDMIIDLLLKRKKADG